MTIDTDTAEQIQRVHHAFFPKHGPTPLRCSPSLAAELGCKAVYIKDESSRFGLPAFKILGASWAIASVLGQRWGVAPWDIEQLRAKAKAEPDLVLYSATDGNHGRAVARTASLLGIQSHIFVPSTVEQWSRDAIASEGCAVTAVDADYDGSVAAAEAAARSKGANGILIQDMSWDGYLDLPARIVQGYMTICAETDAALTDGSTAATTVVVPVGVGSLAHSVVQWYSPNGVRERRGTPPARIISAEPESAPCLNHSLARGEEVAIPGSPFTVMAGLNCGTINPQAWPDLKAAIVPSDAIVVNDKEALQAVDDLSSAGISAGPCGAATLAALRKARLSEDDVVVLICTEGKQ